MSNIPSELKYTTTHEWVRLENDGTVIVGITDHAQGLLGDLVYVELPAVETEVKPEDEIGVVESVKAASDIYSPLQGEIIEVNELLNDNPELVNTDPYGSGWLLKMKINDESQLNELMDADTYESQIEAEHQ